MADVTISQLTKGTPLGSAVLPYSQNNSTYSTTVSSVLQGSSFVEIGAPGYPNYNYNIGTAFGPYAGGQALLTLGDFNRFDSCAIRFTQAGGSHVIGNNRPSAGGAPNPILSTASNADFVINNDVRGPGTSIVLATSGLERMRIDKDGNVGIGVVSPTTNMKMDLYGNLRVAGKILLSDITPPQGTEFSQVSQVFAEGSINANSSVTLNLNGVSTWPCAGMLAVVLQSRVLGLRPSYPNSKSVTVRLGSFVRTLGSNSAVSTIYTQDTSLLSISDFSGSGSGLGNTVLTNSTSDVCDYSVRVLPVLARIWPVT